MAKDNSASKKKQTKKSPKKTIYEQGLAFEKTAEPTALEYYQKNAKKSPINYLAIARLYFNKNEANLAFDALLTYCKSSIPQTHLTHSEFDKTKKSLSSYLSNDSFKAKAHYILACFERENNKKTYAFHLIKSADLGWEAALEKITAEINQETIEIASLLYQEIITSNDHPKIKLEILLAIKKHLKCNEIIASKKQPHTSFLNFTFRPNGNPPSQFDVDEEISKIFQNLLTTPVIEKSLLEKAIEWFIQKKQPCAILEEAYSKYQFIENSSKLRGKLPQSDEMKIFNEEKVKEDGNCAFNTLGADRETLSKTLIALKDNEKKREYLGPEIYEAFISYSTSDLEEGLKPNDEHAWQQLIEEEKNAQAEIDQLMRKIKDTIKDNTLEKLNPEETVKWLEKNEKNAEAEALKNKNDHFNQVRKKFDTYCHSQAAFEYYINALKQDDAERPVWLGYRGAILYAQEVNLTLYIWKKLENSTYLKLEDFHEAKENSINVIHMLYTNGFTHFNLLSEDLEPIVDTPSLKKDLLLEYLFNEYLLVNNSNSDTAEKIEQHLEKLVLEAPPSEISATLTTKYKNLLSNKPEKLKQFEEKIMKKNNLQEQNFQEAEKLLEQWITRKDIACLLDAFDKYKLSPLKDRPRNLEKITNLIQEPSLESEILQLLLMEIKGEKKELLKKKKNETANKLEAALKDSQNMKEIYYILAQLRYRGKIFKKNLVLARAFFKKAIVFGNEHAVYPYAKMCFYGEGGIIEIKEAELHSTKITLVSPETIYLKSNFIYLHYLESYDRKDQEGKEKNLNECIQLLEQNIQTTHAESLLSLCAIAYYDKEEIAKSKLQEVCNRDANLIQILKEQKVNGTILSALGLEHSTPEPYSHSIEEILEKESQNPLALAKISDKKYHSQIVERLQKYYQLKGENGLYSLITTLCYEAQRHPWDDVPCSLLRETIGRLSAQYKNHSLEKFKELLKNKENTGNYYDEYSSEDSDGESDKKYQSQTGKITARSSITEELINKIYPEAEKKLDELLEMKKCDEETYDKKAKEISSGFAKYIELESTRKYWKPKNPDKKYLKGEDSESKASRKRIIEDDLKKLNHYSAQGKLAEVLPYISTNFLVAQTRGIHFDTKNWNQPQRRKFRTLISDEKHLLVESKLPLYSRAVYDRAGITALDDLSPLTHLRLKKVAYYIYYKLRELKNTAPLSQRARDSALSAELFTYEFSSRALQIQQFYTNNYDKFHTYLEEEMKQEHSFFVSTKNPFLSFGDIESIHSSRYAYGLKYYDENQKEQRLRPRYNQEGRALRPYSGVVFLTLHPLSDYARENHHHIVSLYTLGELVIDPRIIHERECSFFSFIPENRLKIAEKARYPSFHYKEYLKSFKHKYGLPEILYNKFKHLITKTKPHDPLNRLAILLLGEYLCAYNTLYLIFRAHEKARGNHEISESECVLVYHDKFGNFSLKLSHENVSPTPTGNEDPNRLLRLHTHVLKETLQKRPGESNNQNDPKKTKSFSTKHTFYSPAPQPPSDEDRDEKEMEVSPSS